jgi:hypothetical protein
MKRRTLFKMANAPGLLMGTFGFASQWAEPALRLYSKVWKFSFGTPEMITLAATNLCPPTEAAFTSLPAAATCLVTISGSGSSLLRSPSSHCAETKRNRLRRWPAIPISLILRDLNKKLPGNANSTPVPLHVATADFRLRAKGEWMQRSSNSNLVEASRIGEVDATHKGFCLLPRLPKFANTYCINARCVLRAEDLYFVKCMTLWRTCP